MLKFGIPAGLPVLHNIGRFWPVLTGFSADLVQQLYRTGKGSGSPVFRLNRPVRFGFDNTAWKPKCPKCNEEGHYAKTCKGPPMKKLKKNAPNDPNVPNVVEQDVQQPLTPESVIGSSATAVARNRNVRYPVLLFENDPPTTQEPNATITTIVPQQPNAIVGPQAKSIRKFVPPRKKLLLHFVNLVL